MGKENGYTLVGNGEEDNGEKDGDDEERKVKKRKKRIAGSRRRGDGEDVGDQSAASIAEGSVDEDEACRPNGVGINGNGSGTADHDKSSPSPLLNGNGLSMSPTASASRSGSPGSPGSSNGSWQHDSSQPPPGLATASYYTRPVLPHEQADAGGYEAPRPWEDPGQMTRKLHLLSMSFLFTSFMCLLAIVSSRSLGIGKWEKLTVGCWDLCIMSHSLLLCSDDIAATGDSRMTLPAQCWAQERGLATASGVTTIFATLLTVVSFAAEALQYRSGDTRIPHFLKLFSGLSWLLWLLFLVSWSLFVAFRNDYNECTNARNVEMQTGYYDVWYAWGFVFYVAMWMLQTFFAVVFTMKALKMRAPCQL